MQNFNVLAHSGTCMKDLYDDTEGVCAMVVEKQ